MTNRCLLRHNTVLTLLWPYDRRKKVVASTFDHLGHNTVLVIRHKNHRNTFEWLYLSSFIHYNAISGFKTNKMYHKCTIKVVYTFCVVYVYASLLKSYDHVVWETDWNVCCYSLIIFTRILNQWVELENWNSSISEWIICCVPNQPVQKDQTENNYLQVASLGNNDFNFIF